jgi:hypothetical protein
MLGQDRAKSRQVSRLGDGLRINRLLKSRFKSVKFFSLRNKEVPEVSRDPSKRLLQFGLR